MLEKIAELKKELEKEIGGSLTREEIVYLEQIGSIEDLKNYGEMEDLAYDAGIALGLSDEEASSIIESTSPKPIAIPENYEDLKKEYLCLVEGVNILRGIESDAEYQMIEELSAEGFAGGDTLEKIKDIRTQLSKAETKLEKFKYENSKIFGLPMITLLT